MLESTDSDLSRQHLPVYSYEHYATLAANLYCAVRIEIYSGIARFPCDSTSG